MLESRVAGREEEDWVVGEGLVVVLAGGLEEVQVEVQDLGVERRLGQVRGGGEVARWWWGSGGRGRARW